MTNFYRHTILLVLFGLIVFYSQAQPNQRGGVPLGIYFSLDKQSIACSEHNLTLTHNDLEIEDALKDDITSTPYRVGISIPASVRVGQNGVHLLDNGSIVWQQRIISTGSLAISLIFNDFIIPHNGKLFIYTPDGENILGYFDAESSNRTPFVTQIIPGDELIIEYSETESSLQTFANNASIEVSEIIHFYRGYKNSKDLGNSGGCQVNVNCPEGNEWQKQKRGVAKVYLKKGTSWYNCSGSLVNNTANDGASYFLTADHCGGDATEEERSVWQFYFQFERPDCSNDEEPVNSNFITGCSLVSRAPMSGGSDFQLLKLTDGVPRNFLPYFNGWDRSSTASKNGVSIHHPVGDVKKISTYTRTLTTTTPNISGSIMAIYSAWRVYWARTETNHGVTEKGSSGSPLFSSNGMVVGTLSGGNSACTNLSAEDFFGKFSYHWQSNGSDQNQQLRPWLDPLGANPTMLSGLDPLVPRNLNAVVESNVVNLSWENPLITDDLAGFNIYANDEIAGHVLVGSNSYSIDYNSKTQVSFFITALFSSPDYESEPSNSKTVSIETYSQPEGFQNNIVTIYPNPAKDAFTVESQFAMTSIRVFAANGMIIKNINDEIGLAKTISASQMPKGLYMVDVITINGYRQVLKLILEP